MLMSTLVTLVLMTETAAQWSAFRGDGSSVARDANPPVTWSDDQGIAWRTKLPCSGQSSPVVWEDQIFVTGVRGETKDQVFVVALDRKSGKIAWSRELPASQKVKDSDYVSRAAPTPIADAAGVYAFFESGELVAFDHTGTERWRRSLTTEYGAFDGNHGVGSSPAASADAIYLLIDHDGPSYLLCVDKATGKNRWKVDRPKRVSWSSPAYITGDVPQVVISSSGMVEGFDAATGERRWHLAGLEGNTVASPTITADRIVIGSSERGNLVSLSRKSAGEIAADGVQWRADEVTSSFCSPLVYHDRVYVVNKTGGAAALDVQTGKALWTKRLPGSCWASTVGAAGRVYYFGKDGVTTVLAADANEFKLLSENKLSVTGRVYGVAVTSSALYLRVEEELICVGQP